MILNDTDGVERYHVRTSASELLDDIHVSKACYVVIFVCHNR